MLKTLFKLAVLVTIVSSCTMHKPLSVDQCPSWADCIYNPENEEFVVEVGFHLGIPADMVTQKQFNQHYKIDYYENR